MKANLLVVEDDDLLRNSLCRELKDLGYLVTAYGDPDEFKISVHNKFDYAILDLRLGFKSSLELIPEIKSANPQARIVILTGYGSIATATKAIKLGATNYLIKPAAINEILSAFEDVYVEPAAEVAGLMPSLAENERQYIEFVLEKCDGNKTIAANHLKIPRQSLQRKLRKYSPWKLGGSKDWKS